jgi:hypothetical protein
MIARTALSATIAVYSVDLAEPRMPHALAETKGAKASAEVACGHHRSPDVADAVPKSGSLETHSSSIGRKIGGQRWRRPSPPRPFGAARAHRISGRPLRVRPPQTISEVIMNDRRRTPAGNRAETAMTDVPPSMTLLNLIAGSWTSQAISVAARLGIADLLEDGPRSCSDLAQATMSHPDALYRLLRALAGIGIFAENGDGRFELTPLAEGLQTKAPVSLCAYAILFGEEWYWRAWGELLHGVRTGECAFEHVSGMQVFDYFARHAEAAKVFDAAMTSRSSMEDRAIAAAYDFACGTIVDVGGGRGSLLITILRQNPRTHGILFDRPHVVAGAAEPVDGAKVTDRCQVMAGDFFDRVPAGGDIYLMKKIIHDWDDERARAILTNCRAALTGAGRLLLLEQVILPGNGPSFGKVADLQMLVMTPGGRERTQAEYQTLLAAVGFELIRIIPTDCPLSIIEAAPR